MPCVKAEYWESPSRVHKGGLVVIRYWDNFKDRGETIMKRVFFLIALVVLPSLSIIPTLEAQTGDAETSVETYFDYLKDGDTEGILILLTDPLLSERKRLLENNSEYPEFLRKTYQGASMEVKNSENVDKDKRVVDVEIHFADGSSLQTKFLLKMVDGSWKIAEEIPES
jgi:hypothetical protein